MVEQPTSCEHEFPCFEAIGKIPGTLCRRNEKRSRLVVADHPVEPLVGKCGRWQGIVEIENGNLVVGACNDSLAVGDVLRNQVSLPHRISRFRRSPLVDDQILPGSGHGRIQGIRLIDRFEDEVVETTDFLSAFADQCQLEGQEIAVGLMNLKAVAGTHAVDMICGFQRGRVPQAIGIVRAEYGQFHDHSAVTGSFHEVPQAVEESGVPLGKIEFVSPVAGSWDVAAGPRCDESSRFWRERVVHDAEGAGNLTVGPAENPDIVQTTGAHLV